MHTKKGQTLLVLHILDLRHETALSNPMEVGMKGHCVPSTHFSREPTSAHEEIIGGGDQCKGVVGQLLNWLVKLHLILFPAVSFLFV
jgi:hypothetical protein